MGGVGMLIICFGLLTIISQVMSSDVMGVSRKYHSAVCMCSHCHMITHILCTAHNSSLLHASFYHVVVSHTNL